MLDPRFKLHVFRNQVYAADIKKTVIDLVTTNINNNLPIQQGGYVDAPEEPIAKRNKFDIWDEYDTIVNTVRPEGTPRSQAVPKVQRYPELPVTGRQQDPLEWWKTFKHSFPNLAVLARKKKIYCYFCTL
ncbi:unnamed protein product [Parnassius apollo]|uniref:(apollo) hypothetical protein n=1 Tax=Parnassius apollo TaxID=110799 RepID=A0A8S3XI48_PARAO|nr:unnamed protein product [Parnassius apollo]